MLKRPFIVFSVITIVTLFAAIEILAQCAENQVQCGTVKGNDVCLDINPTVTENIDGTCTYTWNVFNATTSASAAIGYQCAEPEIAATDPEANRCGVGSNFGPFKGVHQLDSVTITADPNCSNPQGNCQRLQYTINECSRRGANDVLFKFGNNIVGCTGSVTGFGDTNIHQSSTRCITQALAGSTCVIETCFEMGAGNRIVSYDTSIIAGEDECEITLYKAPVSEAFPGSAEAASHVPDGTLIKFGTDSCYCTTYLQQTTCIKKRRIVGSCP
jgi:hypothetical protein